MRNKLLLPILAFFVSALYFGHAYPAWIVTSSASANNNVESEVTPWNFGRDDDFAVSENIRTIQFLDKSVETQIVSPNGGGEAVRLTNTEHTTQTKSHIFNVDLDRDYEVGEIKVQKIEFDYYHAKKRQQSGKGFPKVQLLYNDSTKGNAQGGVDTLNSKSPLIATNINDDWWHLEYFITAMVPTLADKSLNNDNPISEKQLINGIQITDSAMYDYGDNTAFVVIDNLRFSSEPAERLGLFNRTDFLYVNKYFWIKTCWVGDLHSVSMSFSDDSLAMHNPTSKSPFYIKGLAAGTVTVTVTLEVGDNHEEMTIQTTLRVLAE